MTKKFYKQKRDNCTVSDSRQSGVLNYQIAQAPKTLTDSLLAVATSWRRRHLANAYELKAGMAFIAGKTV